MTCRLLTLLLSLALANMCLGQMLRPDFDPTYRPDPSTDEGGFWYQVDKLELDVRASPYLVRDPALNDYISQIVCSLAGDYCDSIRVYIIDNPSFNASMYPNGMMHVNSGLLLRVEDEAQLAAVLGHEIAHFLRSHQIKRWRSLRSSSASAIWIDVGIAALTGVSGLAQLAAVGAAQAYSREHETEADLYGLQLLAESGYDPRAAARLWELLGQERSADQSTETHNAFLASHPSIENRNQVLLEEALKYEQWRTGPGAQKPDQLLRHVTPNYAAFLQGHMQLQEYGQAEVLLARHKKLGYPPALVEFFLGELHRLRKQDGDLEAAIGHYRQSIGHPNPPASAFRELGYLQMKAKNHPQALQLFRQYLVASPEAGDQKMIEFYIQSLEKKRE